MKASELSSRGILINTLKEKYVLSLLRALGFEETKLHSFSSRGIPDYETDDYIFELKKDITDLNRIAALTRLGWYSRGDKPVYVLLYYRRMPVKSKRPMRIRYDMNKVFYVDELIDLLPEELKKDFISRKRILDSETNSIPKYCY